MCRVKAVANLREGSHSQAAEYRQQAGQLHSIHRGLKSMAASALESYKHLTALSDAAKEGGDVRVVAASTLTAKSEYDQHQVLAQRYGAVEVYAKYLERMAGRVPGMLALAQEQQQLLRRFQSTLPQPVPHPGDVPVVPDIGNLTLENVTRESNAIVSSIVTSLHEAMAGEQ